ncbi:unnamed protein product [Medioppia subpectinata]|uniref:Uncharacterized protein n=1 Tax=Medioppia subpectinata TaxID=1979941 RepID=A0A7R9KL81_9ACAR|nr:unnamed protein product [Medioppia subpectinata]CAG2105673.1 unnamed protein product [Medioppia subpectinata]
MSAVTTLLATIPSSFMLYRNPTLLNLKYALLCFTRNGQTPALLPLVCCHLNVQVLKKFER